MNVAEHVAFLRQGEELLAGLSDEAYPAIGPHLRHAIEHYDLLFAGIAQGRVDYDARSRDARLETERTTAAAALARIRVRIEEEIHSEDPNRPLRVASDEDLSSSLGRELHYLLGHTIHPYAIVASILRAHEMEVPPDFGVAPSTLRYRNASCAR